MIRYGNDLPLTDLARMLNNYMSDLNACLRDGHLDTAFYIAENMDSKLDDLRYRLNDLRFGKVK